MSLGTVWSIFLFFLFVAPGLLWVRLRSGFAPPRGKSTLEESGLIVLYSTVFSAVSSFLVVGLTRWWWPEVLVDLQSWMLGTAPATASLLVPVSFAIGELAIALLIAYGVNLLVSRAERPIYPHSAWTGAMRDHGFPVEVFVIATATLTGGGIIRGLVEDYSVNLKMEDRELTLTHPISRVKVGDDGEETSEPMEEGRVIIPGGQIEWLGLTYDTLKPVAAS